MNRTCHLGRAAVRFYDHGFPRPSNPTVFEPSASLRSLHYVTNRSSLQWKRHPKPLQASASGRVLVALVGFGLAWTLMPSFTESKNLDILDKHKFQPFTIISKERISSTSSIFTVRPSLSTPPTSDPYFESWSRGLWSVEFKQPQLQIARAYTPLPPAGSSAPGDLRFLIRREHRGEVSGYIDKLDIGGKIEVRGPKIEYEVPENVTDVVFLAGGTGIAPALQTVHTLLGRRGDATQETRIHILWANRRREDCEGAKIPLKSSWWFRTSQPAQPASLDVFTKELEDLERNSGGRVTIDYSVDEEGSFIDSGKILKAARSLKSDSNGTKILMISGPEGFINHFAGPKVWEGGDEVTGPIRGVLGGLNLPGWTFVKL